MKNSKLLLACMVIIAATIVPAAPANSAEISVIGGKLYWDENSLYAPTGCSSFSFNYENGTGIRLLEFSMEIKSRFGDSLERESIIGMPAGVTGTWSSQICKSQLSDGLGPYSVTLHVEDYNGSVRLAQGELLFISRSAPPAVVQPTPAPSTLVTLPNTAIPQSSKVIQSIRVKLSSKTVTLTWPSVLDAEGYESNYQVRISRANSSKYGRWTSTNFATELTYGKLARGALYRAQVRVVSDSKVGPSKMIRFRSK
jgi:hypothetical protein